MLLQSGLFTQTRERESSSHTKIFSQNRFFLKLSSFSFFTMRNFERKNKKTFHKLNFLKKKKIALNSFPLLLSRLLLLNRFLKEVEWRADGKFMTCMNERAFFAD